MKYPGATFRPLADRQTQPRMARWDVLCFHTMVGYLASTDTMFHANGWGGTESHFGVGGKWGSDASKGYDGRVFQWQDTTWTADANYQGNHRVISVETADNAPKTEDQISPWTAAQVESLIALGAWVCDAHGIPAVLMRDSKPGSRGIGYHRLGCENTAGYRDGWLIAGGERWSLARGKGCPGPARIAQLKAVVVPGIQARLRGDDDMPNMDEIRRGVAAELRSFYTTAKIIPNTPTTPQLPGTEITYWTPAGVDAAADKKLDQHSAVLTEHGDTLTTHGEKLEKIQTTLNAIMAALTPKE